MGVRCEGVKGATAKPPCRSRRSEIPAFGKERLWSQDQQLGRAHLARHSTVVGQSGLGARLRTREVTGRDASLPAPLLAASLELVARGTVGALPQTPQGTLPLDPAKGSSTLWTPIRAIELASPPCFARVFILLALRLPPLPHDSIIPPRCQQIHQCINHRKHHIASNPDSIKQRVIMQSKCP